MGSKEPMSETPIWRRYLRFLGNNLEADVSDELKFHISMRVEDLIETANRKRMLVRRLSGSSGIWREFVPKSRKSIGDAATE